MSSCSAFSKPSGSVRRAVSVVKKRNGFHEKTIRELDLNETGIVIGEPLTEFHGVLTGVPTYIGKSAPADEIARCRVTLSTAAPTP